ncbi:MAG: PQQ-binding-like beta-propeller repeat protein [Deltaproteobacteria bacterium]|nr:PQQ-binding-like beta-propeller repeat protein [Deltaproteobacteria bacterium]
MKVISYLFCVIFSFAFVSCSSVQTKELQREALFKVALEVNLKRQKKTWPRETTPPYAAEGYIFQGSRSGIFAAFNQKGKEVWRFNVPQGFEAPPLYYQNKVYVGANDGFFYCLHAHSGRVVWKYQTEYSILSEPIINNHSIYFLNSQDELYALDLESGKWQWHYKRDFKKDRMTIHGSSTPLVSHNSLYVGFSDGYFVSLNSATGALNWIKKLVEGGRFQDIDSQPVFQGDRVYILTYEGSLYALSSHNGKVLWKKSIQGGRGFTLQGDVLYVSTLQGELKAFSSGEGQELWSWKVKNGSLTAPVVIDKTVLVGGEKSGLHAVNIKTGKEVWAYKLTFGLSARPFALHDKIYIFSNGSKLSVLSKK